ncbi:unannotated protein [freshwater metagenome]|uniref:Unannotated protein n=1 Tax=freshwater metagenome TaxID=449393 RepID=A0A6J7ITX3_9ZZZZ
MANDTTTLTITAREPEGSRSTRRLRRSGLVPGILYGGGADPVPFSVDERELRVALHAAGAVIELALDGKSTPAVLKQAQRHPLRGETTHVDFIRVDLSKPIEATVPVEVLGGDEAPGVREGGILDLQLREVTVEALPNSIPESIQLNVAELKIGESVTLADAIGVGDVTILTPLDTVAATILAPRLRAELDAEGNEIEAEVAVVGESEAGEDAAAEESDESDASGEAAGDDE